MSALPEWAWGAVGVALGPIIGSFIGLLSLRLPHGAPVGLERSACGGCGRTLGLLDLAPLLSFVASGGRCRTCGSEIPRRYPALEVGCAVIAGWAWLAQPGPQALAGALLGWQLLLLAVLDAEHFWLPRVLTVPLIATGLALGAAPLPDRAIGAAAGYLALALIAWSYHRLRGREGLGGGDAWMLAGAGAWVGWIALPTVLLWACAAGLSLVAASMLVGRRMAADARLPFGVFLALGTWLAWLYGPLGLR